MTATEIGTAPEAGPEAKTYRMRPPAEEQFFASVPERVQVSGDDLVVIAAWDLISIDEATFSY